MPVLELIALINGVRQLVTPLRGTDGCPEVRTPTGFSFSVPWEGWGPSPSDISVWYDVAQEQLDRAAGWAGVRQAPLEVLRQQFDALPNRVAAVLDAERNTLAARDIAQAALCLIHEVATRPRPELQPEPEPEPAEEDEDGPTLPGLPNFPGLPGLPNLPGLELPSVPNWIWAAGGAVLLLYLLGGEGRSERR